MAGEKVIRRAIEAARKAVAPEDLLMGIHNTAEGRKLDMIERLGGLPAPSIAITKPSQGYTSFGDISLVAPVEMVTPGRKTPVFGSDVYSPRFPNVEGDQIFRGFALAGNRRYAPLTMENVLREMKGNVRGGEGFNYGVGTVRAQVTPQFGSLPEMQAAREKIIPSSEFDAQKDMSAEMMERLRERFEPYFKPTDSYRRSWSAFPEVLTDYARTGRPSEFAYDYKDLPVEALTDARSFLSHLRDMPTEYFEAKPQRAVPLSEFSGAVVPADVPGSVVDRIRNMGINRIEEYGDDASRAAALMKFVGEQGFADGGEVNAQTTLDNDAAFLDMSRVFPPAPAGKIPNRAESIPLTRSFAPAQPEVVDRALDVVRSEPRPMDIRVSRQAPPPPRPVPRPAPVRAPAPAPAAPDTSESRRLWEIYNETGNPADFVRASNAMRAGRAEGGEVREGYAGGGKPLQQALEAAARYIRPRSPEQAAVDVAGLLRAAREKEVTDSLLEQADPRALFELYAAGRTGADMPMDYASRMGRAADQGFNKLIYRGTQSREALNRSLQTDRLEEGSKTFGTGSWASSDPDVAGTYSGLSEFSPVTMPLMVRGSELREVPWGGGLWSEGPGGQTTDRVARAAREEGAKGLTFSNITDIGPHLWNRADTQKRLPDTSDTTVIFDPSIVRSPFARFDPRLEHLLDLNRKDGGRAVDVARETLLEDQYPTQYLPNVGRQVMADGGVPVSEGEKNAQLNDMVAYADRLDRAARMRDVGQSLSETWPAQLARSIVGGAALPRDVYEGRVDPTSEIGIQRAMDLSGAVMGGGMTVGSAPRGSIGMFLGPSAKTADLQALEVARDMAKKGATRDEIYDATKWLQGADKQWRFEIPDTAASMRPGYIEKSTVGEAIDHPELFKAYPQLADVEFYASPIKKGDIQGMWSGNPNVKETFPTLQIGQYAKDPRSTALHELQHGVQAMENFAPGGNTFALKKGTPAWAIYQERLAAIKKPLPLETYAAVAGFGNDIEAAKKSYPSYLKAVKNPSQLVKTEAQKYAVEAAYLRSAGEVEARNVQTRAQEGYDKRPWETQQFPDEMQIVRERSKERDGGAVEDALHIARGMYADGGVPTEQSRRRATLEQLGSFEDRPVMDPATMGENWANAVRRFRENPVRPGEATVRPLELGGRDVLGGAIAGDGGIVRSRIADIVAGSRGLPGSGTLGMGVADLTPAGIPLAVSDFSDAVRNEDYLSAGLTAGLPAAYFARKPIMAAGRAVYDAGARAVDTARDVLGRVPAPVAAGGAGAAVMTPEEAEASKGRMVQQVMDIVRGITPPPSNKDPRFWHNISSTKLSRPIDEMRAGYEKVGTDLQPLVRQPSDYEGKAFVTALGDPSIGGVRLLSVNERNLTNPTLMQAGPSFVHGASAQGPDRAIWASDLPLVSALANRAAAAQKAGYEPYLNYVKMGGESPDYSHHITDPLIDLFRQSKVDKGTVADFDKKMREGFNKDFPAYADWPGLRSKNLESYLFGTGPGKARTAMAKLMATGDFQKRGMPDVAAVRFAATEPDLLNAPNYSSGRMIARMDPNAVAIRNPEVPHRTYRAQLAAHPEGADPARFSDNIPLEIAHRDWVEKVRQDMPKISSSNLQFKFQRQSPTLYMTPETVDRMSTFLDLKKRGLIP